MRTNDQAKKIKLAILIRNFSPSGGGAERYCYELTKVLSSKYNLHVFSQSIKSRDLDVTFHEIPFKINRPRFINQILFSYYTKRITRKMKFDIIHSHDIVTHADVYTVHVPCFKKENCGNFYSNILKKILFIFNPRKVTYSLIEKLAFDIQKKFQLISVSNILSENIMNNYPHCKEPIIAYPGFNQNSVETSNNLRFKLGINSSSYVILFSAHGFKRKGLQQIVNALNLLQEDIFLLVAGNGNQKEIIFDSEEVKKKTIFLGEISNINEFYSSGDLFIHPSSGDTFGMVVLEAMSHAIPVIVSDSKYCGISELLTSEEAVLLSDPYDHANIAHMIDKIKNNKILSNTLGQNAKTKASKISWTKTAKQTELAYRRLLDN